MKNKKDTDNNSYCNLGFIYRSDCDCVYEFI